MLLNGFRFEVGQQIDDTYHMYIHSFFGGPVVYTTNTCYTKFVSICCLE